mgnify:CR=1 FL=1
MLAGLFVTVTATAQTKIGYLRIDEMVGLLPEIQKLAWIQSVKNMLERFCNATLELCSVRVSKKLQEYSDSTKSKVIKDQILKDLQGLKEKNWMVPII